MYFIFAFRTANTFLRQLAAMSRGRYHRVFAGMDGDLAVHRLLEEGFKDTDVSYITLYPNQIKQSKSSL